MLFAIRTIIILTLLVSSSVIATKAFAIISTQQKTSANMLKSLIVEAKVDFEVSFIEGQKGVYKVNADQSNTENKAAIVKISGGSAEVVIDIEIQRLEKNSEGDNSIVRVYDFNITDNETGSSVVMYPDGDKDHFILAIGGTVEAGDDSKFYEGINILNINYL